MTFEFSAIGVAQTPYPEKFSIPRQPGLVTCDNSTIKLSGKANREEILRGLEGFSHLWLVFVFHKAIREDWKPMVRPPRLGGNKKVGVFASRSPFRPNPIGLSVVELRGISQRGKDWLIDISGCDLVDGTPILDIKPYLPYADSIDGASAGFAPQAPAAACSVIFSEAALSFMKTHDDAYPNLNFLIEQVLSQQPEPAYHRSQENNLTNQPREYGISLYNLNIRWRYNEQRATAEHTPETIDVIGIHRSDNDST